MKEICCSKTEVVYIRPGDFFDNNPFLLYNVDIISDLDLSCALQVTLRKEGIGCPCSAEIVPGKRFLLVDNEGRLRGWRNISTGDQILACENDEGLTEIAFSSMHIAEPEIFKYMGEGIYTLIDLYLRLAADHKIYTLRHDEGYWVDVGTPESLEQVRKLLGSGE